MSKLGKTRRGSRNSVSEITSTVENEGKDNGNNNRDHFKPVVVLEQCSELTKIPEDPILENSETAVTESNQSKDKEPQKNKEKSEANSQKLDESLSESLALNSSDTTEPELEKLCMEVSSDRGRSVSPILNCRKTSNNKTLETDIKLTQQTTVLLEVMDTATNKEKVNEAVTEKNNLEVQETNTITTTEKIVLIEETVEIVQEGKSEESEENIEPPSISGDESDDLKSPTDEDVSEQSHKITNGDNDTHSSVDDSSSIMENASTAVNYSENTRYIDNSFPDDSFPSNTSVDSKNSFVEQTRDLSYIKTLKTISGRKNLHDLRHRSFYNIKKHQESNNSEFYEHNARNLKRKHDVYNTDDYGKRTKIDSDDSGLFSYVSSPINKLKTRFSKSQQSTPIKNIQYQNKYYNEAVDHESIDIDEKSNKWCTIQ